MADWFYYDDQGRKNGPYPGNQTKELFKQGLVTKETMVEDPSGRVRPMQEVLQPKPHADPNPFATPPPVLDNPFTAPMPAGENPFTATMPRADQRKPHHKSVPIRSRVSDPAAKRKWGTFIMVIVAIATVCVVGYLMIRDFDPATERNSGTIIIGIAGIGAIATVCVVGCRVINDTDPDTEINWGTIISVIVGIVAIAIVCVVGWEVISDPNKPKL